MREEYRVQAWRRQAAECESGAGAGTRIEKHVSIIRDDGNTGLCTLLIGKWRRAPADEYAQATGRVLGNSGHRPRHGENQQGNGLHWVGSLTG